MPTRLRGVTVGLYAGSFDPPQLGHLSLIDVAATWCETLYVVAAGNPDKHDGLFDLVARHELLEAATAHLPSVVALHHAGLVAPLAVQLGVDVLVRGMGKEQVFEFEMAAANRCMSGISTVFLPPEAATGTIASRAVREAFEAGGADAVASMVPEPVLAALRAHGRGSP